MPSPSPAFETALAAFARIDATDPRTTDDGPTVSERYHGRVAAWVCQLEPEASEAVRLAARCQHIRRWTIPRTQFDPGRTGYKQWRSTLARQHAADAVVVLGEAGYDAAVQTAVADLLVKKRLRSDPQAQLLEDAVCLTFIELGFADFAAAHPPEKVASVVRKTWGKMSARGHAAALRFAESMPASQAAALQSALDDPDTLTS